MANHPDATRQRLFFAVLLADELRPAIVDVQERIARAEAKVKWVEPDNLHYTLKFLGDTPGDDVPRLAQAAREVAARRAACDVHIAGAGAFPRPNDVRVVWLGCHEGAEALGALAGDLDDALHRAGLADREARPFRAHLTIGRNKSRHRAEELAQAIQDAEGVDIGVMRVAQFVLMRSQLRPSGPVYTIVESFPLQS